MLHESNLKDQKFNPGKRVGINPSNKPLIPNSSMEKTFKKQEIELLKYQFENKILIDKLHKINVNLNEVKDPNIKRVLANSKDIDLNYNTKTNYVTLLEEKIAEMNDLLFQNKMDDHLVKMKEMVFELFNERKNYKDLKNKYAFLKFKYAEIHRQKAMFDKTLETSRKMRSLLKAFSETGQLNKLALAEINFQAYDKILDSEKNPYIESDEEKQGDKKGKPFTIKNRATGSDQSEITEKREKSILDLQNKIEKNDADLANRNSQLIENAFFKNSVLQENINEIKESFKTSIQTLQEKHQSEVAELNAKIIDLEAEKMKFNTKLKESSKTFEDQIEKLKESLFNKELELKDSLDTVEVLKEKSKKLEERINKMVRDNKIQASKILNCSLNSSKISRNTIAQLLENFTNSKLAEGSIPDKLMLQFNYEDLKEINEDLNKYDQLGQNFEVLKEMNAALNSRIQDLEKEIEENNQNLDEFKAENRALKKTVDLIEYEKQSSLRKMVKLEKELEEQNLAQKEFPNQILKMKEQISNLQTEASLSKQNFLMKETELANLKSEFDLKKEEANRLQENIVELQKNLANAKQSLNQFKQANETIKEEMSEILIENKRVSVRVLELEGMKEKIDKSQLENSKLVNELEKKELNLKLTMEKLALVKSEILNLENVLKEKKDLFKAKIKEGLKRGDSANDFSHEQLKIMQNLLTTKDDEICKLNLKVETLENEKQALIEKTNQFQKRFNSHVEEQQLAISKVNELSKFKTVVEEMKNGEGDYVNLKLKNIELQEENNQLKEYIQNLNNEISAEKALVSTNKLEIEPLTLKNVELQEKNNKQQTKIANLQKGVDEYKQKVDDFLQTIDLLQKNNELKDKENIEFKHQINDFKSIIEEVQSGNILNESVEVKLIKAQKERVVANSANIQIENNELKLALKNAETKIKTFEEEITKFKLKKQMEIDYIQIINDKDRQIIEMAHFSNEKTEKIEQMEHQIREMTAKLKIAKDNIDLLEDRLEINAQQLYQKEIPFINSNIMEINDQAHFLRRKSTLNKANQLQMKNSESQSQKLYNCIQELEFEINKLKSDKRELEEKSNGRYNEIARLMNQISELIVTKNQFEVKIENLNNTIKDLERKLEEREVKITSAGQKSSKLKLEINSLLIDKKLLTDKIAYLNENLKEKDQEITKVKNEYYEAQENFTNATEDFLQKLKEQKSKNSKRELITVEMQSHFDEKVDDFEKVNSKLEILMKENNQLHNLINDLNGSIEILKQTQQTQKPDFVNLDQLEELKKNISQLENQNAKLLKTQNDGQKNLIELQEKLKEANEAIENLQTQLRNTKIELESNILEKEKVKEKINELNDLKAILAEKDETIKNLQRKIKSTSEENKDYEQVILEMRTNSKLQMNTNQQKNVEFLMMQEKFKQTEKLLEDYKMQIEEFEKLKLTKNSQVENSFQNNKLLELEDVVQNQKIQLSDVNTKLAEQKQETTKLENVNQEIRNKFDFLQGEKNSLQNELDSVRKENEIIRNEVTSYFKMNKELQNEISELNQSLNQIREIKEKEKLDSSNNDNETFDQQLTNLKCQIEKTERKLSKKKEKIKYLKLGLKEAKIISSNLDDFKNQLSFENEQIISQNKIITELKKNCTDLQEKINNESFSSNKFKYLIEIKDSEIQQLKSDNSKFANLEQDHHQLIMEMKEAKLLISDKNKIFEELQKKNDDLEFDCINHLKKYQDIEKELFELNSILLKKQEDLALQHKHEIQLKEILLALEKKYKDESHQMETEIRLLKTHLQQILASSQALEIKILKVKEDKLRDNEKIIQQMNEAGFSTNMAKEKLVLTEDSLKNLREMYDVLFNRYNDLESEKSEITRTLNIANENLNAALSENEKLKLKISHNFDENQKLQAKISHIESNFSSIHQDKVIETALLEKQLSEKNRDIENLQLEIENLKETKNKMNAEISMRSQQKNEIVEQAYQYYDQIQELSKTNEELNNENFKLKSDLLEKTSQVDILKAENELNLRKLNDHEKEIEQKTSEVKKYSEIIEDYKNNSLFQEKEIEKALKKQLQLENECNQLKSRFEQSLSAERSAQINQKQLEDQIIKQNVWISSLKNENNVLETKSSDLTHKTTLLLKQNENLQNSLQEAENLISSLQTENLKQAEELNSIKENLINFENYIQQASKAIETSTQQNLQLKIENKNLSEEIQMKNKLINQLKAKQKQLLSSETNQQDVLLDEFRQQKENLANLSQQLYSLTAELKKLIKEKSELLAQNVKLQKEKELAEVNHEKINQENDDLKNKFRTQIGMISHLENKSSEYRSSLVKIDREKLDFQKQKAEITELTLQLKNNEIRTLNLEDNIQKLNENNDNIKTKNEQLIEKASEQLLKIESLLNEQVQNLNKITDLEKQNQTLIDKNSQLQKTIRDIHEKQNYLNNLNKDQKKEIHQIQDNFEDLHELFEKRNLK